VFVIFFTSLSYFALAILHEWFRDRGWSHRAVVGVYLVLGLVHLMEVSVVPIFSAPHLTQNPITAKALSPPAIHEATT
jgi:hypothetical protein